MTLHCSCGDTFSDQDPLNGDVILPWFHSVAGHTLSEVETVNSVVTNQTRRTHGRTDGVLCERRARGVFQ